MSFISRLFPSDRSFSSYDECPELFYRFNGRGEYGPGKLDAVINYQSIRPGGTVECRFADERVWRPKAYFDDLWQRIPPSQHSLERLRKEGVEIREGLSEPQARAIISDIQKRKPATAAQIKKMREAGIAIDTPLDREQAKTKIRELELAQRARDEQARRDGQRLADVEQLSAAKERLASLVSQVRLFYPNWTAHEFEDLEPLEDYIQTVKEALDYAHYFDGGRLDSEPFNDPTQDNLGYYLSFKGEIRPDELRIFQGRLFSAYLETKGNKFDHLTPLKTSFSNIEISNL
jgi:hypothetical protein